MLCVVVFVYILIILSSIPAHFWSRLWSLLMVFGDLWIFRHYFELLVTVYYGDFPCFDILCRGVCARAYYMIFCVRLGSCSGVFSGALVLCSLAVTFGDF